ncbi:hypothetical protein C8D89_111136 [Actinomycetospora cinnamomea]|uniref:Small secreted domain DUF320 n=1 Tax=Actinomycetospora cinnamomea TaxID=663609 RepID=A0A2U1F6F5_9PSEU|nr:hypothetical protein C8D89_111136 [Actinomycetospora cinnamomea]
MLKKLGLVTLGVSAGLVAVAPIASAHESDHSDRHHGDDSSNCNVVGGEAEANGGIDGDAFLGNALVQAPIGGNNAANIVCNDILNGNLSGNDVAVAIGGDAATLPEFPEGPDLPVS